MSIRVLIPLSLNELLEEDLKKLKAELKQVIKMGDREGEGNKRKVKKVRVMIEKLNAMAE